MLFIPTYNCEKQIVRVLAQISPELRAHFSEVVVFDNRSADQTLAVAKKYCEEHSLDVTLRQNPTNVNLGGTHKLAFRYALEQGYDFAVVLHGDDQANLRDFSEVFGTQSYRAWDYYCGARFASGSRRFNYSFVRTCGNNFFNLLAGLILGKKISDFGGSGLNIFSMQAIEKIGLKRVERFADDLTFHVELLLSAYRHGQRVCFAPITWREHDQVSNAKVLRQALRLLRLLFNPPPHLRSIELDERT